jgi:hypothetical protein
MANVHKDFHGALSYGIQFLTEEYGREGAEEFLRGLAETVYAPLVKRLREEGIIALRDHWDEKFTEEGGAFSMRMEENALVLDVSLCPAVHHMKSHGYTIAPNYCEHTRLVNEAICAAAGYACSVEYDQDAGRCVQRFWKEAS